jgi:hypothetical protein
MFFRTHTAPGSAYRKTGLAATRFHPARSLVRCSLTAHHDATGTAPAWAANFISTPSLASVFTHASLSFERDLKLPKGDRRFAHKANHISRDRPRERHLERHRLSLLMPGASGELGTLALAPASGRRSFAASA